MNEEHLGQLQQVLSDLEEGLRMRQQDKARIVELENCIKGLIFSDIIRNDGAFITMRGIAINNLDRACKAIGATIDLDALCTAQPSAGVTLPERAEAERQAAELREERDILQRQLDRFYSQSHGITALSEIERLHARIATLKEIRMPILPPQCTDKLHHVKYRAGWNCCLSEVARLNPCRAQAVPDGWVMVPVDPTPEMLDRYPFNVSAATSEPMDKEDLRVVYQAMLAAAPSAQQKESGDE